MWTNLIAHRMAAKLYIVLFIPFVIYPGDLCWADGAHSKTIGCVKLGLSDDLIRISGKIDRVLNVNRRPDSKSMVQFPQTIENAEDLLFDGINMAASGLPAACFEYQDVFYFSGGMSTSKVTDFSCGFAVRKGSDTIYSWESLDDMPVDLWRINGAKVETVQDAEELAIQEYKMKMNISEMDQQLMMDSRSIVLERKTVEFNESCERVWEIRMLNADRYLAAAFMINSRTGKVKSLYGPWDNDSYQRNAVLREHRIGNKGGRFALTRVLENDKWSDYLAQTIQNTMVKVDRLSQGQTIHPITIADAAKVIAGIKRSVPSYCFENNEFFFFANGCSADLKDFRSGFAMRKGQPEIYQWNGLSDAIAMASTKKDQRMSIREAQALTLDLYIKKMNMTNSHNVDANVSFITLSHKISDFSENNEEIVEARFLSKDNRLQALLWLNPQNNKTRFLYGM